MAIDVSPSKVDPFISKVSLGNFKSVVDQEVDLGRLTLLVGENSSGKSSILQVLRLLQQSLQSESAGNRFPLNGDLIRMGDIDEIRTAWKEPKKENVTIGAEIIFDPDFFWNLRGLDSPFKRRPYVASWNIDLNDTVPDEPGSTRITGLRTNYQFRRLDNQSSSLGSLDIKCRGNSIIHPIFFRTSRRRLSWGNILLLSDKLEADTAFKGTVLDDETNVRVSGVVLRGSLPLNVTVKRPAKRILAEEWLNMTIEKNERSGRYKRYRLKLGLERSREEKENIDEEVINDEYILIQFAIKHINTLLEKSGPQVSPEELFEKIPAIGKELSHILSTKRGSAKTIKAISKDLKINSQYDVIYLDIFDDDMGVPYIRKVFERIKYLGPLREEPQFIMLTSPTSSAGHIGSKGEFTAAVLYNHLLNKQELSILPVPDNGPAHSKSNIPGEQVGLIEAIKAWSTYLGLVEDIHIEDLAALGLTIKVKPHGVGSALSLPSVGVGVSQLLPVLVVCLLAEPGSVILLEQPELHLHPALQQRLADFFIAISRSGRQLIVETHSEYIISRLRRRIAEDADDELMNLVKIIFAERDRKTGETQYRDLDLTPYGDIEEWPKGFFDQAAEDEREIIRGALKKQKARKPSDLPEGG